MIQSPALHWLGAQADALDPLLRELHARGGVLRGQVHFEYGAGPAGLLGRGLARRLGLRLSPGMHAFEVWIRHDSKSMHWDRCFEGGTWLRTVFTPVGTWPDGYWVERIGGLRIALTVEVSDGAWHWRLLDLNWHGLPLPRGLLRITAYKRAEQGRYRFHAGFALAGIGQLFAYEGLLEADLSA
jgi:hypothetical protein